MAHLGKEHPYNMSTGLDGVHTANFSQINYKSQEAAGFFLPKKKKRKKTLCSDARFALGMEDDKADNGLYTLQIIPVLYFMCTINSQPCSVEKESSIFAKKGQ